MNNLMKKAMVCFSVITLLLVSGCESAKEEPPKVEEVAIINNDIYESPKNPTQEEVLVFNDLSKALGAQADDSDIASLVAVNFAYNFYSLYAKESKSDIGGLQFLPEETRADFSDYASYKYYHNYDAVISNYSADDLPKVIAHQVQSVNANKFIYNQLTYDGFEVALSLQYEASKLGVETLKTSVSIQVIQNQGVYQVVAAKE